MEHSVFHGGVWHWLLLFLVKCCIPTPSSFGRERGMPHYIAWRVSWRTTIVWSVWWTTSRLIPLRKFVYDLRASFFRLYRFDSRRLWSLFLRGGIHHMNIDGFLDFAHERSQGLVASV